MKTIVLAMLVLIGLTTYLSAQEVVSRNYYSYTIDGIITDESGQPSADINVCWWPVDRPLGGRIPCTKSNEKGRYILSVKDVPEKYVVRASNYDSLILLADAKSPGKAMIIRKNGDVDLKRIVEYRSATTDVLTFGPSDESRTIDLQLTLYRWSDAQKEYLPVKPTLH
jgi:hypothetical protein